MIRATIDLPFGKSTLPLGVPKENLLGVFTPQAHESTCDDAEVIRQALQDPIGSARLRDIARPGQRVAIVTSDLTRPCPSERMLPPVLDELSAAGVCDSDVCIVAALGLHRPMTEAELRATVGPDAYGRARAINHDPGDVAYMGTTSRGTPVEISRPVVEAELRICLGNLEYHYFAGFSGGAKAILPGCASKRTINANHAMMVDPGAAAGRLEGNPVRADLEEGAAMVGVDFILNVVSGSDHRISHAVAGNVTAAHRRGCEAVAQRGRITMPRLADVVVVSAGGYPKDVNLYQAQKALDNAAYAVRDGGTIILVAECPERFGNATFERWLRDAGSPDELLRWIQEEFVLGGHKAAAIGAVLKRARVYLVSGMPAKDVEQTGMVPFARLEQALGAALGELGSRAFIAVLPQGGSVLPVVA